MSTVAMLIVALLFPPPSVFAHGTQKYVNGFWFNGQTFESKTIYIVEGVIRLKYDGKVDATVDLHGKYVIPPFAEAHNHNFSLESAYREDLNAFLRQGIFYAKNTNNSAKDAAPVRQLLNRPETVDVLFANGGLTATGGHPAQIYDRGGPPTVPGKMDGEAYFTVDTEKDLERKWQTILAGKPDFIKTYLEFSEEYEKRKADPQFYGKRGLNPKLLPLIVRKARAAGLRVAVHINTAADFRNAVSAGVDEIAHLPLEKLTDEAANAAARRRVVIVTTTLSHRPTDHVKDVNDVHRHNINVLRKAGARLAIGTDDNNHSVLDEAENLKRLGVFDNLELLKLMVESTPQTIFPNRKIGLLKDGYEGSFLVLDGNPLEDFANVRKLITRVKKGHTLTVAEEAAKLPSIVETIAHTLMGRGVAAAIAQYRQLKRERPAEYDFAERELNRLGYELLRQERISDAIEIFKLNVEMYPQGFNTYDSLAEAYMKNNDREQAIKNYEKSLELNPHNANAVEMLKKLR